MDDSGLLPGETEEMAMERRKQAKAQLKEQFNTEYDDVSRGMMNRKETGFDLQSDVAGF